MLSQICTYAMTFGEGIVAFNRNLQISETLPDDIGVMNPFLQPETMAVNEAFYRKYYNDNRRRIFLMGINPGRHGAGVTGVCFTDGLRMERDLGIPNPFPKNQTELSASFIFDVIKAYGGPERFYGDFYVTAVCPLGFVRHGRNLNYYDDKMLLAQLKPYMAQKLQEQIAVGGAQDIAICIGEGENYKHLQKLNATYHFFERIEPLPHPRFVMQYRLRRKEQFIKQYTELLGQCRQFLV